MSTELRRVDLAGLAAAAGLTAAAYFGGLEPIIGAMRTRADLLGRIETEQAARADLAASCAELRRELRKFEDELDSLRVKLAPQTAQNDRLAKLMEVATEAQLKVDQLQPQQAEWEQRYGKVPVRMIARGGYGGMTRFMSRLAEFPDLGVRTFSMGGESGSAEPRLVVELVWYVMPREPGRE